MFMRLIFKAIRTHNGYWRTLRLWDRMDDRALDDLGVYRGDLESMARRSATVEWQGRPKLDETAIT